MKIAKMEELVANARIIDESTLDVSKALVLSTVKIKNQANGMELKYTLVAESEADLKQENFGNFTYWKRIIRKK